MKRRIAFLLAAIMLVTLATSVTGLAYELQPTRLRKETTYDNGRYRGTFSDGGVDQVSVEFRLEGNIIKDISFRHLFYKDVNYRTISAEHPQYPVWLQHQEIIKYLKDKPITAMYDLYNPKDIVDNIDGFTGATVRGSKVLSAMQDALNRGLYVPSGEFSKALNQYQDGTYRGGFSDGGIQQVSIEFELKDNIIDKISYRQLFYGGVNYRTVGEDHEKHPVRLQHQQLLDYLKGKPLTTIFDLYKPADFIDDIDAFTGATVRANKVLSAMRDGLNRGLYKPAGENNGALEDYEDGTYRGVFIDGGTQQVSIEFDLKDNIIDKISYRHLFYSGVDYRTIGEDHAKYPVRLQNQQLLEHLKGKSLTTIFDLYKPGDFIKDIDTFTGATVRANKVLSAVADGLNRGPYKLAPIAIPTPEPTPEPGVVRRGSSSGGVETPSVPKVSEPISSANASKMLVDSIQTTGKAMINLSDASIPKVAVDTDKIQDLFQNQKPLLIQNKGLTLQLPPDFISLPKPENRKQTELVVGAELLKKEEASKILSSKKLAEKGLVQVNNMVIRLSAELLEGNHNKKTPIQSFLNPVAVTIDLSEENISLSDIQNLTGTRYVVGDDGTITPIKLGGSYDPKTKTFTFFTDQFSLYGVSKADRLSKLLLTINDQNVRINDKILVNDVAPMIIQDRTMVPLRLIAESFGAEVDWIGQTRTVTIQLEDKVLELHVDKTIPGMDVPPVIRNDRTLVPLRYISEILDSTVMWFPSTRSVQVVR